MQIPAETRKTNTFMGQTVDALEWMQSISFLLLYAKRNVLLSTITFYKSILINPSVLRASWSPDYGLQTFLSDPSWVESMRWNGVLPSFVVQWKQDVSVDFISHVWWWGVASFRTGFYSWSTRAAVSCCCAAEQGLFTSSGKATDTPTKLQRSPPWLCIRPWVEWVLLWVGAHSERVVECVQVRTRCSRQSSLWAAACILTRASWRVPASRWSGQTSRRVT